MTVADVPPIEETDTGATWSLTRDDRPNVLQPGNGRLTLMPAVLILSLLAHGGLVGIAYVTARQLSAPPEEVPVEIVHEIPKPEPKRKPDAAKPETAKAEAKAEPVKAPEPPSKVPPEPTPTKPPPKPAQTAAAKPDHPKPDPPKPEPAKPPPAQPETAKPAASSDQLADLQKELADLRAQKDALAAEAAASRPPVEPAAGLLLGSQQAVALPGIGDDGEVVGYQDLVFSQLAKAKGDEEYKGRRKGTTGVTFDVGDRGELLDVTVALSSGDVELDRKAIEIVRKAAPFPPPPKGTAHHFAANVNFIPPER